MTERSIAAYEAGDIIPYRYLRKIAEFIDKSPNWILYGEEASSNVPSQQEILDLLRELHRKVDGVNRKVDKLLGGAARS